MAIPSAILETEFMTPSGPNIEPAGASPNLKQPSATWPESGNILRELNNMWIRPGMLDMTGTGFATPSAIQKQFQQPNVAYGGEFSFPGLDFPPIQQPGGGAPQQGTGALPASGLNIMQLLGVGYNLLKNLNPGQTGNPPPEQTTSTGGPQEDLTGGPTSPSGPTLTGGGLLESMQSGAISPNDLMDQYGNLNWNALGINWNTDPTAISNYFSSKGIDINAPSWLEAEYGLNAPSVIPNQFNLGADTSINANVAPVGNMSLPGGQYLPYLSLLTAMPGIPPQLKQAAQAAQGAYQGAQAISNLAQTGASLGNLASGVGAIGAVGGLANQMAGGPQELSYALSDLGLLAASFSPMGVISVPMLLTNILQQTGAFGDPWTHLPPGYVPVGAGLHTGVNPLTGQTLQTGKGSLNPYQNTPATPQQLINWNVASPLYQQTLPSVQNILFGPYSPWNTAGMPNLWGASSQPGLPGYNTFNQAGTPGGFTSGSPFAANAASVQGGSNPYWDALNWIYQTYLGRPLDPSGANTYGPLLVQGSGNLNQIVNSITQSPEYASYVTQNPAALLNQPTYIPPTPDPYAEKGL